MSSVEKTIVLPSGSDAADEVPGIVCLMGATASGKTDLAVALVEQANCEIISVDSALIYRGMDIGTAKPDAETLARAPHRLIDIRDPSEAYSAAEFRRDVLQQIAEIQAAGRTPLLVGGTMLYFKALLEGLAELPPSDPVVREKLLLDAQRQGLESLHRRLAAVDPVSAQRIHPNDPQRLQRALEVYEVSGYTLTELWERQRRDARLPFKTLQLSVELRDRAVLHARIAERFEQMLELGFEAEVRALYERGDLHPDLPSIRCVGYRQMWEYLAGDVSRDRMIERSIVATRQLAKRQLTWLRSWPELHRVDPQERNFIGNVLKLLGEHII